LLHLADITEEGVTFQSPVDGKPMLLTPEESIHIQNNIGADIIMALDDVVKTTITGPRIEEAMYRTLRWIDRCIAGMNIFWLTTIELSDSESLISNCIISLTGSMYEIHSVILQKERLTLIVMYYPMMRMVYLGVCLFCSMFKCSSQET